VTVEEIQKYIEALIRKVVGEVQAKKEPERG
jgi:hypothetical protein